MNNDSVSRSNGQYLLALSNDFLKVTEKGLERQTLIDKIKEVIRKYIFRNDNSSGVAIEQARIKIIIQSLINGNLTDVALGDKPLSSIKGLSQSAQKVFNAVESVLKSDKNEKTKKIQALNNALYAYEEEYRVDLGARVPARVSSKERFITVSVGGDCQRSIRYDRDTGRYTYTTPSLPIKNLAISGGGAKGIYLPGVVAALEERGVISGLKTVSGASIGSITAALVAAGVPVSEIAEIKDFRKYLGEKTGVLKRDGAPIVKLIRQKTKTHIKKNLIKILKGKGKTQAERIRVYLKQSGQNGDAASVQKIVEIIDKLKQEEASITFADLRTLHQFCPETFKELVVTAKCCDSPHGVPFYFSADNTPDLDIAVACRASASHPLILNPVKIDVKLLPGYDHHHEFAQKGHLTFIDGGYLDNIPVSPMEPNSPLMTGHKQQNLQTLAIVFDEAHREKDAQSLFFEAKLPNGRDLLKMAKWKRWIMGCFIVRRLLGVKSKEAFPVWKKRGLELIREKFAQRCIPIKSEVGTIDFEKAEKEALKYQKEGHRLGIEYVEAHESEGVAHSFEDRKALLSFAATVGQTTEFKAALEEIKEIRRKKENEKKDSFKVG